MKNINEIRNYLIEEINQNELMSKKHKKVRKALNYIEHLLIIISTISVFTSLVRILTGITSSANFEKAPFNIVTY